MSNNLTTQSATPSTIPDNSEVTTKDAGANGHAQVCAIANQATAVAAATVSDTVIKNETGVLVSVLVTAADSNPMEIYDNATTGSGTIIGLIPANAPAGSLISFQMPAANGITVKGHADNPAVTISHV